MEYLRIGLVAPPWFSVPPPGYGGIERVVQLLADGLAARGHDVTLFASGGSKTRARLFSTFATPPSEELGDWTLEGMATTDAYRRHDEFDVIHDHTGIGVLFSAVVPTPVVHTTHGAVGPQARLYAHLASSLRFVCISGDQQASMPPGCDSRVIYNAVDTTRYPFNPVPDDYLLFVGRMSPDKGILDAIEIARAARRRLLVLAKINEPPERAYFRDEVLPALRGVDSEVLEQPEERVKVQAYQFATATLFPIAWREPFGLVMVESMATGTPVIAYRAGSVPEIVKHGETGFVCATREQAIAAVEATPSLSRPACRQDVETRFSPELMVRNHERLYAEIVRAQQPGHDDFDLVAAG